MPTNASTGTEQLSTAGGGDKTKAELQEEAKAAGVPTSGTKAEIADRLAEAESTDASDAPEGGSNVPQPEDQGGPTSAVTSQAEIDEAKQHAEEEGLRDDNVPEANTTVIDNAGLERNTPDGAVVVTHEDDVVGGVRVDLPPSAPASVTAEDLRNRQGGTVQVSRPDGTQVSLDSNDPDFEDRAQAIREGKRNH